MRHKSKYQVPNFQLHELVQAHYGYQMSPAPNNSYYCTCPIHNHSTPGPNGALRIYANDGSETTPDYGGYVCPRGDKGNAWTFLHDVLGFPLPSDADFDQTIEFICETLNIEPVLREDYEETAADRAYALMRDLKDALQPIEFSSENKHYWQENGEWLYRGISPMVWLNYGVGMIGEFDLQEIVDRYEEKVFEAAGISHWGGGIGYDWLSQGVAILRTSPSQAPLGIAVRRYRELCGSEPEPKYAKNNRNSRILRTRKYIFGLDALREDESPELFVVEGEFDALSLRIRGVPNVVTFGSGQPTSQQMQTLWDTDRHLVFIADADSNQAGFNHVASIARQAPDSQFIVMPGQDTDPDDFVQKEGADALLELPRYTSLQVQMLAEEAYNWEEGRWTGHEDALVSRYMNTIIDFPSVFDEQDVSFLAAVSGYDEDYLRSYLFRERNIDSIAGAERPLQLQ